MSLQQTLQETLKNAMKAKQMDTIKVLRSLQAAIKQIQIDQQITLDDAGILQIIQKQIKQRQESLAIYQQNNRPDLAEKEQFELDVLQQFLPEPLSLDALTQIIQEQISALGATSMADMGKVMNAVKEKTAGRAQPAEISALIKKTLSQK